MTTATPTPAALANAISAGRRVLQLEAEALQSLSLSLDGAFARAVQLLLNRDGRIVVTGVGKSGHVARKIASTFASTGTPAFFMHAGEASHGDLGMVGSKDVVVALSKSGEARELADIIGYAKRFDIPIIAITAEADSPLGHAADVVLVLPTSSEASGDINAPTTSTTLQMALGDALAVALLELRGFSAANFKIYHPGGKLGAQLQTVGDLMHGPDALPLVRKDAPMTETLLVMTERRFGCVGVCGADGKLIGLITDGDLRRHMDGLLDQTAGDVMTASPLTVRTDALAAEALNRMEDRRITVLLAVDDGYPVGIIHIHDLLRAGVA